MANPGQTQMLAGSFQLKDVSKMPVYQFAVNETVSEIPMSGGHICRTTKRPRFANLLVKEFVSSGRYADSSHSHLEVKDDTGGVLLSIPIRQFGFEGI